MALPLIPRGARPAELKQLVSESLPVIGGTVSKKEAAWLKRVAEHPAADVAVLQTIVDGTSALVISDSAIAAGARDFLDALQDKVESPAAGSVIDVRTSADEALSRPFGEKEAELPSLPVSLDHARLSDLLKSGWKDVKDGGVITSEELAWVHAVATHPAADGRIHDEISRRLDGANIHESVNAAVLGRLRRGLRGEVPLIAAPAPRPVAHIPGAPVAFGEARWPKPGPELDAAELGRVVDQQLKAHRKTFSVGESQVLDEGACAWLLEVAKHPNADADLARKIGFRMQGFKLSDEALILGGGRLRSLLDTGAVPAGADAAISLQTLRVALAFVTDVLTEAAGPEEVLDAAELQAALKPLDAAQTAAVRGMYEAVASSQRRVTVPALRALYQEACANLDAAEARVLAKHEVTQLCAFGSSLVDLSSELDRPDPFDGLSGDKLKAALAEHAAGHIALGYDRARQVLFAHLDNDAGVVKDVYTGRDLVTSKVPDAEGEAGMNTEHTYPRSRGVKGTQADSDLHHLFPADAFANAQRSSYPFGEVVEVLWSEFGAKLGLDARGETVFEPPDDHKGNVARALFYVSTTYALGIDASEAETLRRWNKLDAVDPEERVRNDQIERAQGNRNPFIDDPKLAERIDEF